MKILVTGGAGFIASHIVDSYVSAGIKVVIVDNLSTGKMEFINKKARFYKADITDRQQIARILKREKPDIINHHAAQISVRQSVEDPLFDAQVNLIGLLNLLFNALPFKSHLVAKLAEALVEREDFVNKFDEVLLF